MKEQGKRSTCVAFAATAGHEYVRNDGIDLSEEFLYWGCKQIDGQLIDNGTRLSSAITTLNSIGQCKEENWPYDPFITLSPSTYFPSAAAQIDALNYKASFCKNIPNDKNIVQKKMIDGYAVIAGIILFQEFFNPIKGFIELPQNMVRNFGKHAILISGWDSNLHGGVFIIRNSWGEHWGTEGYGFLPYEYFESYTVDVWCFKN